MSKYHPSKIDYNNRTVDLLLLKTVFSPVSDKIVDPDVSSEPMMVTGIEKLVQRFTLLFLTQLGTVRNSEREGTEFMSNLGSGRIYDESTLRSAASAANNAAMSQIRSEDARLGTPDDEALERSVVIDAKLDRGSSTVSLTIGITTVSGDTYTYITPIKAGV